MWVPKNAALSRERRLFEDRRLLEEIRYSQRPEMYKTLRTCSFKGKWKNLNSFNHENALF